MDESILNMHDRAWSGQRDFELVPASRYKPEAVRWLWPRWLALGKLHLLAGSPGTGKTTIALSLAAAVTTGAAWPDGGHAEVGSVLFWSGEDGIADTLVPRFLAAGGDPDRLHFASDVVEGRRSRAFDPAEDLPKLIAAARELPGLRLVVLDPVVSTITGDSHKNTETRRGLQPVVDLAQQLDVAVIGITHLSKGTSGREPHERVSGSIAFSAVARVVLATVKAHDRRKPHRLVRAKSNLGPDSGGVEYTLTVAPIPGHEIHAQRIDWGQSLDGSAQELMSIEAPDAEEGAEAEAKAFLEELLAEGPVVNQEVRAAAAAHGHKWRTVERAKAALGVTAAKHVGGKWHWALPGEANSATEDQHRQPGGVGGVDGEDPTAEPNPANPDQHRQPVGVGGVDGEDPTGQERRITDLEDSIVRQRNQVRTLASLQYRTEDAERLLRDMERQLAEMMKK